MKKPKIIRKEDIEKNLENVNSGMKQMSQFTYGQVQAMLEKAMELELPVEIVLIELMNATKALFISSMASRNERQFKSNKEFDTVNRYMDEILAEKKAKREDTVKLSYIG